MWYSKVNTRGVNKEERERVKRERIKSKLKHNVEHASFFKAFENSFD